MERYEQVKVTPTEALEIYLKEFPSAVVEEVELRLKGGRFIYEVEGIEGTREQELKIDATSGEIVELETKFLKNTHQQITKEATEKVEPLLEKVLSEAEPGSSLHSYELDIEKGGFVLKVRLSLASGGRERRKYDLETGALMRRK